MNTTTALSTQPIVDLQLESALAAKLICEGVARSNDQPYHFAEWHDGDLHITAKQLPQSDGAYLHSVVVSNYRFRWNAMQFEIADRWTDVEFTFNGELDEDFLAYLACATD